MKVHDFVWEDDDVTAGREEVDSSAEEGWPPKGERAGGDWIDSVGIIVFGGSRGWTPATAQTARLDRFREADEQGEADKRGRSSITFHTKGRDKMRLGLGEFIGSHASAIGGG